MESRRIGFAGWDARAGRASEMDVALGRVVDRLDALRVENRQSVKTQEVVAPVYRAPPPKDDPRKPAIGKWAVVVLREDAEMAREALLPLIERRKSQGYLWQSPAPGGGGDPPGMLVISRPPTQSPERWVKRIREAANRKPPYYLLLIGGPDRIPFEVEQALNRAFATGRIDVSDTPDGPFSWGACRAYAEKVARYEAGEVPVDQRALLYSFATDEATKESHEKLSMALAERLGGEADTLFGPDATTARLCEALRDTSPALVVTASHGLEFPVERALWGALTDSSFGLSASPAPFGADAVKGGGRLGAGSIVLSFACFSAGVPGVSAHQKLVEEVDGVIPGAPFTAALPRTWLGRADGPVAFAGHVDRATSHSFRAVMRGEDAAAFFDFAGWVLGSEGTLGQAMSTFHERAGEAASELASVLSVTRTGAAKRSPASVVDAWVRFHDYAGYILLGDPAIERPRP